MSLLANSYMYIGVSFHGAITAVCHGKKAVAFDYVQNGKTRDLFNMLNLNEYYVTHSKNLFTQVLHCHKNMLPVDIKEKVISLHHHFDAIIGILKDDKSYVKNRNDFICKLSKTISKINMTFDSFRTMNYNYEILKSQFAQLDDLSRTVHMQHANLQQEHASLQQSNANLQDHIKAQNTIYIKNNEEKNKFNQKIAQLQANNNELRNQLGILNREKSELEQWKNEMISSRTYSFINKINNIKKNIKK